MLWKQALDYAYKNKAKYTLVQNTPDSKASKFYEKQNLSIGSKVYSYKNNFE